MLVVTMGPIPSWLLVLEKLHPLSPGVWSLLSSYHLLENAVTQGDAWQRNL